MVNYLYESLCRYFTHLCHTGYMKQADVIKLLILTCIQRLVDCDFRGHLNEENYNKINTALYNLYGTTCLMPYPDYYSNKDRRIMYTCSISELVHRISKLEKDGVPGGGGTGIDEEAVNNLIDSKLNPYKDTVDSRFNELEDRDIIIPGSPEGSYPVGTNIYELSEEQIQQIVASLSGVQNELASRVTAVENKNSSQDTAISSNLGQITSILSSIAALQQAIDGLDDPIDWSGAISNLQTQINTLRGDIPDVSGISSSLDDLSEIVDSLSAVLVAKPETE